MSQAALVPKLRFSEFSDDWEEKRFVDITTKISDGIHSTPNYDEGGTYSFVNGNNLVNGVIKINSQTKKVDENEYTTHQRPLGSNTILISINGTIGNLALYNNEKVVLGKSACYLNINEKDTDKLYVFNLLRTCKIKRFFNSELTGSTIKNLSLTTIKNTKLNLPTKPEQQKIAAFLTAVDNKIEQLSKKQALLGEYKKGLTQQIFSQAIRFKADDGSDFPDWKEKKLENVLKRTSTGLNPRQNFKLGYGENYYVTIKNISNGKLDFSKCERIDENAMTMIANRSDLSKGDLIMSSIGNVGESYLLDKEPENWNINESVFMLRASELMLPQFLYFIITNEQSKWYLESNSTGSSFKSIKLGELKLLPLGLPSLEEQTKIANFLSSIDTKIEQVGKQLDESKQFKKALLQQMFV